MNKHSENTKINAVVIKVDPQDEHIISLQLDEDDNNNSNCMFYHY